MKGRSAYTKLCPLERADLSWTGKVSKNSCFVRVPDVVQDTESQQSSKYNYQRVQHLNANIFLNFTH